MKNRKHKNTNGHQNEKKKTYFCSLKMVPQEVVQFLILEAVQKLTLERPKRGTETNPPYIWL